MKGLGQIKDKCATKDLFFDGLFASKRLDDSAEDIIAN